MTRALLVATFIASPACIFQAVTQCNDDACDGGSAGDVDAGPLGGGACDGTISDWCMESPLAARRCSDAVRVGCGRATYSLAQDENHIVWATVVRDPVSGSDVNDIWAATKPSGGWARPLARGVTVNGISINGGWAYWGATVFTPGGGGTGQPPPDGFVARAPLDGGATQVLVGHGEAFACCVVADDTYAYWLFAPNVWGPAGPPPPDGGPQPPPPDVEIRRVPLTGSATSELLVSAGPSAGFLMRGGTSLYWANETTGQMEQGTGQIQTASTAGGPATVLYSGLRSPALAQASEGWLYWSEGPTPGQVRRGAIAGGGPIEVLAENLSMPRLQLVDGDRVWWLASTGLTGEVRSAPLDGGESVLELATATFVERIVVDDASIYLSTNNGVWRLPK